MGKALPKSAGATGAVFLRVRWHLVFTWRFATPAVRIFIDRAGWWCHHFDMTNLSFGFTPDHDRVAFHRAELGIILSLYGRMVAAGEWRDYAMSFLREVAVFSVFRRASENPLYRIEKRPRLRAAQGQYAVIGMDGRILKRGHDLPAVLRVLEKKLIRPVD